MDSLPTWGVYRGIVRRIPAVCRPGHGPQPEVNPNRAQEEEEALGKVRIYFSQLDNKNNIPRSYFDRHYRLDTGDQKRQKVFDFAEEDNLKLELEYQATEAAKRSRGAPPSLSSPDSELVREQTPGKLQRIFTRAYNFTPLEFGQRLRGYSYHAACGFPETAEQKTIQIEETSEGRTLSSKFLAIKNFEFSDFFEKQPYFFQAPECTYEIRKTFIVAPHPANRQAKRQARRVAERKNDKKYKHLTAAMANSADATLFDESFTVTTYDDAKYDRVARLGGVSADSQTTMTLDINSELLNVSKQDTIHLVLASSLALDGTKDDKGWRDVASGEPTLADMFDYVCHGKVYKFEDSEDAQQIKAYISFGGLLMALEGPYKKLTPLRVDYVYLLLKK